MFLLDTNAVSELRKVEAGRANPGLAAWASRARWAQMFLSVITIEELEIGVLRAERSDPEKGATLRSWLDAGVAVSFASRILTVDERVARQAARLHVPNPAPFRDALIGATALAHDLVVVTRNSKDFERFDSVAVLNPWS